MLFLAYTIGKDSPDRSFETDVDLGYLLFANRLARPVISLDFKEKWVSLVLLEVASVMEAVLPYADWLLFVSSNKALMSIYWF